ncbi:MAG: cyd operon protein YbgE [Photobacterium frigidiphilum]|uniref:cyd operon protein YbgE n=1 Tax=Photobacterium frigidiphilum TaxID=264736 RepID=UPI003001D735
MSSLSVWVTQAHQLLDNTLLRALSFLLALASAGLVVWEPIHFAQAIGGFDLIKSPTLIWATCSAMIYGVGFVPRHWYWQVVFTPFIALPILSYIMWLRFSY